jgi:hypothetical protein
MENSYFMKPSLSKMVEDLNYDLNSLSWSYTFLDTVVLKK